MLFVISAIGRRSAREDTFTAGEKEMATQPDYYDFSNDTGLTIPDTSTVRSGIVSDFQSIFGANIDTTEETHLGRFIDELTEIVVQTTGVNAQNANQFNLNYATGTFLDNLGAAFGISRVTASNTSVIVTMTCTSKITIPQGTMFSTDDGYDFALSADVTVPEGSTFPCEVTGTATAVDSGIIYCPIGTLTTIKTSVIGLVSVTNEVAGEVGRPLETDYHFRNRIKTARESGSASCGAILNAIYALTKSDGDTLVSDAIVLENGHAYPVVKEGIVLPAHSVFICVTGDDGLHNTEIATAIYETKTAGADYTMTTVGSELLLNRVDVNVSDSVSGISSAVSFFRPVKRGLKVTIKVNTSGYTGTDAKNSVEKAIQDYLGSEGIGASITEESMVTAIAERVANTIVVTSLALEYDGLSTQSVKLSAGESFTILMDPSASVRLQIVWE